jgi:hypothetical protein
MKTVTFNPMTHKVISLDADTEMTTAFARVFNVNRQKESFNPAYRAMIAAAPEYPADKHCSILRSAAEQALASLRHHVVQTRPINSTEEAINALVQALASKYHSLDAGWISVDERLPDDGADFIGYLFYKKRPHDKQIRVCRFLPSEHVEVTHWMPLPPAPEAA